MVGQAHVLRALVNALDQQRLHHAYLFTGTRGVGKTSIARLLAKCLNCEVGVSSSPCGICSACTDIANGRFIDLIEVDAASRTKVEDTRELLENVQYAPSRGRFKVYLIDEVHMLSTSSFNALLKTLEEPPPHVKFLLATTDPQKLPMTVLSRCLQFNLKNMSREHIVQHLHTILAAEQVPYDEPSLWSVAEAARGSMRDALSLTDQAIAFGQGALIEQEVAAMLGSVDLRRVLKLVRAIFEKNIDTVLALVAEIDEHAPDYQALMTELMSTLHRVAIAQAAPSAIDNQKGDQAAIIQLAGATQPEDVHLFYQIAIQAKPDLALAPSERAGFEMALLRMVAFSQTPARSIGELPALTSAPLGAGADAPDSPKPAQVEPESVAVEPVSETPQSNTRAAADRSTPPWPVDVSVDVSVDVPAHVPVEPTLAGQAVPESNKASMPRLLPEAAVVELLEPVTSTQPVAPEQPSPAMSRAPAAVSTPVAQASPQAARIPLPVTAQPLAEQPAAVDALTGLEKAQWPAVDLQQNPTHWWQVTLHRLGLVGMTKTLFAHSEWVAFDGRILTLNISPNYKKVMTDNHLERFLAVIGTWLPGCCELYHDFKPVEQTPQLWVDQLVQAAHDKAYDHLKNDAFFTQLVAQFDAELNRESAQPIHNPIPSGD